MFTFSQSQSRGPRIKHVCRRASVALGKPLAKFGDLTLSALPNQEKERVVAGACCFYDVVVCCVTILLLTKDGIQTLVYAQGKYTLWHHDCVIHYHDDKISTCHVYLVPWFRSK